MLARHRSEKIRGRGIPEAQLVCLQWRPAIDLCSWSWHHWLAVGGAISRGWQVGGHLEPNYKAARAAGEAIPIGRDDDFCSLIRLL
jgi:hypothetical protein